MHLKDVKPMKTDAQPSSGRTSVVHQWGPRRSTRQCGIVFGLRHNALIGLIQAEREEGDRSIASRGSAIHRHIVLKANLFTVLVPGMFRTYNGLQHKQLITAYRCLTTATL